jgi:hypothetical protein
MGNALVVGLVERVARELKRDLERSARAAESIAVAS